MNCVDYVQRCSLCGSGDEKFTSQNMLREQTLVLLGAGKILK